MCGYRESTWINRLCLSQGFAAVDLMEGRGSESLENPEECKQIIDMVWLWHDIIYFYMRDLPRTPHLSPWSNRKSRYVDNTQSPKTFFRAYTTGKSGRVPIRINVYCNCIARFPSCILPASEPSDNRANGPTVFRFWTWKDVRLPRKSHAAARCVLGKLTLRWRLLFDRLQPRDTDRPEQVCICNLAAFTMHWSPWVFYWPSAFLNCLVYQPMQEYTIIFQTETLIDLCNSWSF